MVIFNRTPIWKGIYSPSISHQFVTTDATIRSVFIGNNRKQRKDEVNIRQNPQNYNEFNDYWLNQSNNCYILFVWHMKWRVSASTRSPCRGRQKRQQRQRQREIREHNETIETHKYPFIISKWCIIIKNYYLLQCCVLRVCRRVELTISVTAMISVRLGLSVFHVHTCDASRSSFIFMWIESDWIGLSWGG